MVILSTGRTPTGVTAKGLFLVQESYVLSWATLMNSWQRDSRTSQIYKPQEAQKIVQNSWRLGEC